MTKKSKIEDYALIYCRIASLHQTREELDHINNSIPAQETLCRQAISNKNYLLARNGTYSDVGKSAMDMRRPGLKELLARIRRDREIRAVFVHNLDRIARSVSDYLQIDKTFKQHGVQLIPVQTEVKVSLIPAPTPEQVFVDTIMTTMARTESETRSRQTKRWWALKKAKQNKDK